MLKKHLAVGVRKGALTEEQAEEKFNAWLSEKTAAIDGKRAKLSDAEEKAKADALAAEKAVNEKINFFVNNKGKHSVDHYHKLLGKIMWDKCGMARNEQGLKEAMKEIADLRADFWKNVIVPGDANGVNAELEKAGRVADFLELGELFAKDALEREESCGGHFREEYVTEDGEARRDDENFAYVAAWEYKGEPSDAQLHKEELEFNDIKLKQRSYK